jgi:hypothetical protein
VWPRERNNLSISLYYYNRNFSNKDKSCSTVIIINLGIHVIFKLLINSVVI